MGKIISVGVGILLILFLTSPLEAAGLSFHWGVGAGMVFPEFQAFALKGMGEISLGWISFRTSVEFSSLFGVSIVPVDETVVVHFGRRIKPYLGLGGGLLMMQSKFGSTTDYSFNTLGGVKIKLGDPSLFTQLKLRVSGKRGLTYQLDMGVLF